MSGLGGDHRGVSEAAGVAALVALTVLVTASVGVGVLFVDQGGDTASANFTYQHLGDTGTLLITHAGGDDFSAGDLVVAGPGNNVTWAALAGTNASATVTEGDIVQIGEGNEYGQSVSQGDDVRVVHAPAGGNRTVLDRWEPG